MTMSDAVPVAVAVDVFIGVFDPNRLDLVETKIVIEQWRKLGRAIKEGINLHVLTPLGEPADMARLKFELGLQEFELMGVGGMELKDFQRGRRIVAETVSKSGVYVVADPDCMPVDEINGNSWLNVALATMEAYPEFAILTPTPSNATINSWTGDDGHEIPGLGGRYKVLENQYVMEHVNVGGIRFTRKGHLPQEKEAWREQKENRRNPEQLYGWTYDQDHCAMVRQAGGRVGLMKRVKYQHLGEGR
jgi:hypothetical protein